MANNNIVYGKKLTDKRNDLKYRISEYLREKGIDIPQICTDAADNEDYLISPSESTLRGYHSTAKAKVPVEYLITLHDLYDAPYNYLFGLQDTTYEEKDLETKLSTEAYETIAQLSEDEFSLEVLNSLIENYLPALIEKIKAAYISKLLYGQILKISKIESKEIKAEQDIFDTSIYTDILLYLKQMINDILHDDVINLRHDVDKETFKTVLDGFKARTEVFSELYDEYNKTAVLNKKYTDIKLRPEHEEQIMQQAHNLNIILNVDNSEKK